MFGINQKDLNENGTSQILDGFDPRVPSRNLKLLYDISRKVGAVYQLPHLIGEITRMTERALKAAASSILLLDDQDKELLFWVATGQAGKQLEQHRMALNSGIAGWVAVNGKPVIVNDVRTDSRFENSFDASTGFVTRSIMCVPMVVNRKVIGVIEVLNKVDGSNFNKRDQELLTAVAGTAALAIENANLNQHVIEACKDTIRALAAAIDAKDPHTCGHSKQVTHYALLIGTSLSWTRDDLENLEYAGTLHDVGKIGVDDGILTSSCRLTDQEFSLIRQHPVIGANILKGIPFLEGTMKLVLHHHERYDGKGYPRGLKGEEIPPGARIIAIADAFEAMTSSRPYRAVPLTREQAFRELTVNKGTQFDPQLVDTFIEALSPGHLKPGLSVV